MREVCKGCGSEVDPEVCYCGEPIVEDRTYCDNHHPVPMGCNCWRLKGDEGE